MTMRIAKTLLIAALGLSTAAAPALAQSAAPLSVTAFYQGDSGGGGLDGDTAGYLIPGLVLIGVLGAAILLSDNEVRDLTESP